MNILEVFSCSGGMAEGLRRAGLRVTMAFDYDSAACASYEANHGHRPIQMDARDLLRLVEEGWRPSFPIDLFVADPPCTPWSRAGKRLGTADERDMIHVTVDLVTALRPRAWLIANVPGLDDGPNWGTVQETIGSISKAGYCIDFARFDAADYGVPQHRIRPFWFGHAVQTPHVQWPGRTHAAPAECRGLTIAGVEALKPWVTCRQALEHLPADKLGTPVRLRWRGQHSPQHGSLPDKPARVVGTSNLSDGNVLVHPESAKRSVSKRSLREPGKKPRASHVDEPADVVTTRQNGGGNVLFDFDEPAKTLTRNSHSDGALIQLPPAGEGELASMRTGTPPRNLTVNGKHRATGVDEPAQTIRGGGDGHSAPAVIVSVPTSQAGACVMEWPWDRPSTSVNEQKRLMPPGHHSGSNLSQPNAIKLSEKAAAILQGFPGDWVFSGETKRERWSQIGQAMPPPLAEAVGRSIRRQMETASTPAASTASRQGRADGSSSAS